jgi:hypothetical protein
MIDLPTRKLDIIGSFTDSSPPQGATCFQQWSEYHFTRSVWACKLVAKRPLVMGLLAENPGAAPVVLVRRSHRLPLAELIRFL